MSKSSNASNAIRGHVIDELITAENWFALVPDGKAIKVFANISREQMVSAFATVMINEPQYASAMVEAMQRFVKSKGNNSNPLSELLKISEN